MKLQTIKDLYFNGSGIFTRYKENYTDDFNALYGDTDVQFLDDLFLSMYKDKSVSSLIIDKINIVQNSYDLDLTENPYTIIDYIAFLLHIRCFDKCLYIKNLLKDVDDFKNSRSETITETIKTIGDTSNTSTIENIENTYGYDNENPVKDNSSNGTDTGTTTQNIEVTKEYKKSYIDKPIQDLINKEIERARKEDFILLTFQCYSDILFLDIYE